MKTYKILLLIILFPLFFISCSDDDDDDDYENTGSLTIDGTAYELSQGSIFKGIIMEPGQGCFFLIAINSPEIDLNNGKGVGQFVSLSIFSESTEDIKDGIYTVDTNQTCLAGSFSGQFIEGFNAKTGEFSFCYSIKSGSLILSVFPNHFELIFEGYADQFEDSLDDLVNANVSVSFYYDGTLEELYL